MSTVAIIRHLRSLVGKDAFEEAVNTVMAENSPADGEISVKAPKKERKQNKVDPEKSAKRSAEMGALQNFIKKIRAESPDGTPYKEVQKTAGERWKTMSAEEREVYKSTGAEVVVPPHGAVSDAVVASGAPVKVEVSDLASKKVKIVKKKEEMA
jgi:hypothetical protein